MDTKIYKLTQENLDKCLYFFSQTNDQTLNFYKFLSEYKECTKNYYSSLQKSFNQYLISDVTNKNSKSNNKINNNEIKEKKNSIFELDPTKSENYKLISPLRRYLKNILQFFNEQLLSIDLIISSLDSPLILLKTNLDNVTKEISKVKVSIDKGRKEYLANYDEFKNLNNDLFQNFENIEKDIVDNEIEINKRPKEKEELEENLNIKIKEVLKFQDDCQEKLNKKNSFASDLKNNSSENIENINKCIIILFEALKNSFNSFINFFKKSQALTSNEINCQQEILGNKDFGESEIINLINTNLKKIPQKECEIKFKEYDIKILSNKKYIKNKILNGNEKKKNSNSFNFKKLIHSNNTNNDNINSENDKINTEENKYKLSDEDVYNIIKKMYMFTPINRSNYSLETELNKMKVNKITNKILSNFDKEQEIEEKEIEELNDLMKDKQCAYNFLINLNNFRHRGIFVFPKKIFDIIGNVFLSITNNISHKQNGCLYYDLENAELVLIISLTFYYLENSEKIYLRKFLKNNNSIFKSFEFWKIYLHCDIDNDIKRIDNINLSEGIEKLTDKKIGNIIFSHLVPTISNMKDFEIKKEYINNIVICILEKYAIEKQEKDDIMNMINDISFHK